MSAGVVLLWAVVGAAVGWFGVTRLAETFPEPSVLSGRQRVWIALTSAVLFAFAANTFTRWWAVVPFSVLFTVLLAVSVVDLRVYRIPDRIVFPALFVSLPLLLIAAYGATRDATETWKLMESALVGMAVYFGILLPFNLIYPKGMGFGDVKLALVMGLYLGWLAQGGLFQAAYFILIALMLGCIFGVVFGIAIRFVRRAGGAFPFGPALALGAVYVVINWQTYFRV